MALGLFFYCHFIFVSLLWLFTECVCSTFSCQLLGIVGLIFIYAVFLACCAVFIWTHSTFSIFFLFLFLAPVECFINNSCFYLDFLVLLYMPLIFFCFYTFLDLNSNYCFIIKQLKIIYFILTKFLEVSYF